MTELVGKSLIDEEKLGNVRERTPSSRILEIIESISPLRKVDINFGGRARSKTVAVRNLGEFYELFMKTLKLAQEIDGTAYTLRFTTEFPTSQSELPCFTVRLLDRRPWSVNGRKEVGPRYREVMIDQDYPGEEIEIYAHQFENVIRLDVWAVDYKHANELADWVEDKFFEYLWALKWGGTAHPIQFLGRGADGKKRIQNQIVHYCPLTFSVMTQKVTQKRESILRSIAIRLGILS